MALARCAACPLRARYDKNPKSLLGRLWRWHIKWCPSWKEYFKYLPENEKAELVYKYNLNQ